MCSATIAADAAESTPNSAKLARLSLAGLWAGIVGSGGLVIGAGLM
jgi:hypothetical protein